MKTLTVAELEEICRGLSERGYGDKPVYIDTDGRNDRLLRHAYRVQVTVNSQENLVAVIDSVER